MAEQSKNISTVNLFRNSSEVAFGDVWYNPRGECGPRIQQDYQLVIVHLGEANVAVDDRECLISPGSVALMMPGRREHFRFRARIGRIIAGAQFGPKRCRGRCESDWSRSRRCRLSRKLLNC